MKFMKPWKPSGFYTDSIHQKINRMNSNNVISAFASQRNIHESMQGGFLNNTMLITETKYFATVYINQVQIIL